MNSKDNPTLHPMLKDALDQARDEVRRVDAKASMLLALSSVVLIAIFTRIERLSSTLAVIFFWASALLVALAVTMLLLTICPRLPKNPVGGSWLYAAYTTPKDLLTSISVEQSDLDIMVSKDVVSIGKIALRKHILIRRALIALFVALLLLIVGFTFIAVSRTSGSSASINLFDFL